MTVVVGTSYKKYTIVLLVYMIFPRNTNSLLFYDRLLLAIMRYGFRTCSVVCAWGRRGVLGGHRSTERSDQN